MPVGFRPERKRRSRSHDLHGQVDIQVGTLSKAIGVLGGYVAGLESSTIWFKGKTVLFLHLPYTCSDCRRNGRR